MTINAVDIDMIMVDFVYWSKCSLNKNIGKISQFVFMTFEN